MTDNVSGRRMNALLTVTVPGVPAAQGSKRLAAGRMIDTNVEQLRSWRQDVASAIQATMACDGITQQTTAVGVRVWFVFARPKSHYRTGRHADELRPDAPVRHVKTPDVDKLLRALLDAVTVSGLWRDDSQAFIDGAGKLFAQPGTGPRMMLMLRTESPDGATL